ncbi:response regulator [Methyloterricola oryzae]|uniref:response regulator n=1 Tax=Methyloterricola oryzae TaxID=1495050 RepID=UPI0005EB33C7|nr:response regulator [Methyloterricola oryzae]
MSVHDAVEILLVEDNPTDAELTIEALREGNLANHLVWLKDGAQALDFIFGRGNYADRSEDAPPKVIMLDLRLPKVDGMEVLKAIKADEKTRGIPVVVLTSSKEERDVTESYGLGVNSFVSKPVEFEAFARVVAQLGLYWLLLNRPPRP